MASSDEIIGITENGLSLLQRYLNFNDLRASASDSSSVSSKNNYHELVDIAQSHYFTVTINSLSPNYNCGLGDFDKFLPVQHMSIKHVSFSNMSLPVGIYGNLPLLNRRSVCEISMTFYDNDKDDLEKELRAWEEICFPDDRYVNYLENIARQLTYKSYSVKGNLNRKLRVTVIPASTISVTRGYEDNAPKIINTSYLAVGPVIVDNVS